MDYSAITPQELFLVCSRTRDAYAWAEFVRRFQPLIARVAMRVAHQWGEHSPSVIDDLVQETYLKLYADRTDLAQNFRPSHPESFFGYLKVLTANLVHDHFKRAHAAKRGYGQPADNVDHSVELSSKQSLQSQVLIERAVLLQEIDQHLARLVPAEELQRNRVIFWLYFRSGLSASAIASLPSIRLTTKGVESVLVRLTRLVRAALAQPAAKEEKAGDSEPPEGFRQADSL